MFARLIALCREHVGKVIVATGAGSALVGAVIGDFNGWRAANRDFMKRQIEISEQTNRDLHGIIRKFSEKALGSSATTDADLRTLKTQVDGSYLVAARITERVPKIEDDFKKYATALIKLQKCAEVFQGPGDAKCWVEAVSEYAATKRAFDQKVTSLQTSWPW